MGRGSGYPAGGPTKGPGNAIVSQIAEQIGLTIKEYEEAVTLMIIETFTFIAVVDLLATISGMK